MYYNKFKGQNISALGYGGLRFPTTPGNSNVIDREKAQELIDRAVALGINYFDTAMTYQNCDSERFLGEALRKYPRESYYIATKYHASMGNDLEAIFEGQLERMGLTYFDFYLFHCLDENNFLPYTDREYDHLGYLLRQKEKGRIKNLGFSSHAKPETLRTFLDFYPDFDMALIQLNYLDWTLLEGKKQYDILTARGIPVWVMEPMKGGILSSLNPEARRVLQEAAPDRSVSSWGFRFLMGLGNVCTVLSGMSDMEQLLDNAATFASPDPLTDRELSVLDRAKSIFMDSMGVPCSACRYCCDGCPAKLDIPLLIKGYNEKNISGKTWRVSGFDTAKGAENCIRCGACKKACPQNIDIPEIMAALSKDKTGK